MSEAWGFRPQAKGGSVTGGSVTGEEGLPGHCLSSEYAVAGKALVRTCFKFSSAPSMFVPWSHAASPFAELVFSTSKDVLIEKVSAQWRAFI